jgi:hypothetical protein
VMSPQDAQAALQRMDLQQASPDPLFTHKQR